MVSGALEQPGRDEAGRARPDDEDLLGPGRPGAGQALLEHTPVTGDEGSAVVDDEQGPGDARQRSKSAPRAADRAAAGAGLRGGDCAGRAAALPALRKAATAVVPAAVVSVRLVRPPWSASAW